MSNLQNRAIVANYVHNVESSLILIIVIMPAVVIGIFAVSRNKEDADKSTSMFSETEEDAYFLIKFGLRVTWILTFFLALCISVELWAASQLLKACETGREHNEAFKLYKIWRKATIALFVLELMTSLFNEHFLVVAGVIIIRGGVVLLVDNFMKELQTLTQVAFAFGYNYNSTVQTNELIINY